jgi:membrane-bound lytic murein transglycosylase B
MNLTPLRRQLRSRLLGRVKKFVKKNVKKLRLAKQTTLFALTLPLVIPVGAVNASQLAASTERQAVPTQFETSLRVSYDQYVVAEIPQQISIELVESEYMAKLKARQAQARAAAALAVRTNDPGEAEKRLWVQRAASAWGIDWRVLDAVWQVESGRRWYFTGGSSAGARGPCQFMPGTWRAYAQDGNGDGVKDINDARDCLFASAKLLSVNGAANGEYYRALRRYNNADWYVRKVLNIAQSIQ